MLSYARCIGPLSDAAEDYLAELEVDVLERLRTDVASALRAS